MDLRVARNAERRAKEVLGLKQSELEEAQGKLSTYARMYGHANMERMAKLTARVAELEEALALTKPEVCLSPSIPLPAHTCSPLRAHTCSPLRAQAQAGVCRSVPCQGLRPGILASSQASSQAWLPQVQS